MLRPGRLDALMHIGEMDRPGVERLARIVCGDALRDDVDYDAVFAATDQYMPAFVREGMERAIRYSIARTQKVSDISTDDLVHSLNSLRAQHAMQMAANDQHEKLPHLDRMFRQMIEEHAQPGPEAIATAVDEQIEFRLNGAAIVKPNGERLGNVQTN
jgi:SpoVK/Ycf46/Vps4 family AAA+-type ATPase